MAAIAAAAGGRLVERFGSRQVAVPALMLFCGACLAYHGAGAATGLPRSLAARAARLGQRGRVDIRGTDQRLRR